MYKNIFRFLKALLFCTFFATQTNVALATSVYNQTILGELPAGFSLGGKGIALNFSGNLAGQLFQNSKNQAAVLTLPNTINLISGLGGKAEVS